MLDPQVEVKGATGGNEEAFPPLTTVQLHMLLQVFLEVEGLSTGRLWAAEGLLVDVLVLLMVLRKEGNGLLRETPEPTRQTGSSAENHHPGSHHLHMSAPPPSPPDHKMPSSYCSLDFYDLTFLPQLPLVKPRSPTMNVLSAGDGTDCRDMIVLFTVNIQVQHHPDGLLFSKRSPDICYTIFSDVCFGHTYSQPGTFLRVVCSSTLTSKYFWNTFLFLCDPASH